MVFSNSVFLFIFLPIVLLGYYVLPQKLKNVWLFIVSCFFYAWNKVDFLWILIINIVVNYIFALLIEKVRCKKVLLWIAVLLNIGGLFYFKYFNFTIDIIEKLLHRNINYTEVILPIGISFFTFQGLSYVIDVYRKEIPAQKNLIYLGMYIAMFPQLVAGPIVRYSDIVGEISNRKVTVVDFAYGIQRFAIGLFKKTILADNIAVIADTVFSYDPKYQSVAVVWLGAIAYSLQIFYDFAGYSDMAIGLGRMFGFHFCENFNLPYISKSITEFWRRWHISLSSFFRDYVYIPLGGNRKHQILNVAIVFLLTGIWHGEAFTYIVWGIWHGIFNIGEKICKTVKNKKNEDSVSEPGNIGVSCLKNTVSHIYTLLVVVIGWVMFRADSLQYGIRYIYAMFGGFHVKTGVFTLAWFLDKWNVMILLLAVLLATPVLRLTYKKWCAKKSDTFVMITKYVAILIILLICFMQVAAVSYSPFIYFQF